MLPKLTIFDHDHDVVVAVVRDKIDDVPIFDDQVKLMNSHKIDDVAVVIEIDEQPQN